MAKKTKKTAKKSFLTKVSTNSGVRAIAVVILCIALGATVLPRIFADSSAYVSSISATPSNNDAYYVRVYWTGITYHGWLGIVRVNGQSSNLLTWSDNSGTTGGFTHDVYGLGCNQGYTFFVAPSNGKGGNDAPYKAAYSGPTCAGVTLDSVSANGTTVSASWHANPWADGYNFCQNGQCSNVGGANSYSFVGNCGTAYSIVIQTQGGAQAGGQAGGSTQTAACVTAHPPAPTPTPTPTPKPTPTPTPVTPTPSPPSASSSSGGSTTKKTTSSTSKATSKSATPVITPAPGTPSNFATDVVSSKIVQLTWDASSDTDHYVINRSSDNMTWQQLATASDTSYDDTTTDFSTTYYYQLQAVGGDGQVSGLVNAQATTQSFTASSNTVTSRDKLVSLTIPSGAIDGDYNCTLSTDDSGTNKTSDGQSVVLGPYNILCITADGTVIDDFKKPVPVTMKLTSASQGYKNLTIRVSGSKGYTTVKSQYNATKRQITFTLTSSKSFAAFGQKPHSIWGTILLIFFLLLLAAGGVFGFLFWRRRAASGDPSYSSMPPSTPTATVVTGEAEATPTAQQEFREAIAQPDCTHLQMAQQVVPTSAGCLECERDGTHWNSLRICLICGHVGCSDDSEQQHALKHFQDSGHPLIYEYGNPAGNTIGWCYIDNTYI